MANSIFEDNFDSGDITGYIISGPTWQIGGTTDKYAYSLKSYGSYEGGDSYTATLTKMIPLLNNANYFEIKMMESMVSGLNPYQQNQNNANFIFLSDGVNSKSISLRTVGCCPGEATTVVASGFSYQSVGIIKGQWYTFKIWIVGSNIKIQIINPDGSILNEQTQPIGTPIANPDRIIITHMLYRYNYAGNWFTGESYFDNLKILQLAPNVTATNLISTPTSCIEPCSSSVDITWRNDGELTGSFEPAIVVDGVRTSMTQISLPAGQTVTKTFQLSNIMRGTHTLCPDPN